MSPRIWLVTGASTGFGLNVAEVALEHGDIVVATARRTEALSDLSSKYPSDRLLVLKLDITDPEDIRQTFATIKEKFGRLDVVFNNAGIVLVGQVELVSDEDTRAVFETNFWGTANVTREAVKFMRDVNPSGVGGRIIQNSSIAAVESAVMLGYYSSTKFALNGFTEAYAGELDPSWNIKFIIISTGPFDTPMFGKFKWPPSTPAYDAPTNPTLGVRRFYESYVAPGDPKKGMEVVYKVSTLEDPPLYFPLSKSTVAAYKSKAATFLKSVELYESWSDDVDKTV